MAIPAFLAWTASTLNLQDALLGKCPCPPDGMAMRLADDWGSRFGAVPAGTLAHKQSAWDGPGIAKDRSLIHAELSTPREKAFYLAASSPHSGAWLSALPIAACGLRLMMRLSG